MRVAIVDVDDVILQWTAGFREFLLEDKEFTTKGKFPRRWGMPGWIRDKEGKKIQDQQVRALISEFNVSDRFGSLSPVPGAMDGLETLSAMGYLVIAVSACLPNVPGDAKALRHRQLAAFGSSISKVVLLPLGASKAPTINAVCNSLQDAVIIDDNYETVRYAVQMGCGNAILFATPVNQYHAGTWFRAEWPAICRRFAAPVVPPD